jgi:hypothetical protein
VATYDLGKDRPENEVEFLLCRALAIDAYAGVEQSLNGLFAHLLGAKADLAAIVFFRLTQTSRNHIIESLLTKRHGRKFYTYWFGVPETRDKRGLMHLIRSLDSRRNDIVHWHAVVDVTTEDDKAKGLVKLGYPNFWAMSSQSPSLGVAELQAFATKADFVARSINMFYVVTSDMFPQVDKSEWKEIFQQPSTYPPLDTHPLSPNFKGPKAVTTISVAPPTKIGSPALGEPDQELY